MVLGKPKTMKESYADALLDVALNDDPSRKPSSRGMKTPNVASNPID